MNTRGTVRLATRGSRRQTASVGDRLSTRRLAVETVEVSTRGDEIRDELIHRLGKTGAFVRALDEKVLAGDVDAAVTAPSEVSDQRESGEVEYALHFSGQELELYPDVPYVNQAFGTEIVVEQFRGAVVHGDTPDERVEYLRDLFEDIYNTDEFEAYADNNNVNPAFLRGEEFYNYVEGVDERFNQVFQENSLGVYSDN